MVLQGAARSQEAFSLRVALAKKCCTKGPGTGDLACAANHGIDILKGFNPLWIVAVVFGGFVLLLGLIAVLNWLL